MATVTQDTLIDHKTKVRETECVAGWSISRQLSVQDEDRGVTRRDAVPTVLIPHMLLLSKSLVFQHLLPLLWRREIPRVALSAEFT